MKRKLILIISLFSLWCTTVFAASPVIFYSDLTSGPNTGGQDNKGAFVTIWGKNFGVTQGISYVSIGGGQADNYPVWTDTKISFQLGANAVIGDITVTNSAGTSNGVPFTIRAGNIYFVKTTGNDTTGDGSWNNTWQTIIKAKNTIAAGDIAYICDGVSQTVEDPTSAYGACVNLNSSGTASNPKALVAYPGASVNIGSDSLGRCFHNYISGGGNGQYWVISQFNLRSSGIVIPLGLGYRIVGNDITAPNGDGQTAAIEGSGSGSKIFGNEFHNVGKLTCTKMYHNIYIDNNSAGTTVSDFEIGWNIIRDSLANRGIQLYAGNSDGYISNVTIHDNLFYNLRGTAVLVSNHVQDNIKIYNNIIYKSGQGPHPNDGASVYSGIYVYSAQNPTVYIYNNTVYDCGFSGGGVDSGLLNFTNTTTTLIYAKNNIIYSNGTAYEPYMVGSESPITGANYNLFYGKGAPPSWDTAAINLDPQFFNLASYDFHLQATSPAKDAGTSAVSAIVTRDYDGLNRATQGAGYDIGAYEYSADYVPPAYPSSSGGDGDGGGSGCFIATASFGTPMAKEVVILSKFRDRYLLTNTFGRTLTKIYWNISPIIAKYIEKREWARYFMRLVLKPAVWIAKKMVD